MSSRMPPTRTAPHERQNVAGASRNFTQARTPHDEHSPTSSSENASSRSRFVSSGATFEPYPQPPPPSPKEGNRWESPTRPYAFRRDERAVRSRSGDRGGRPGARAGPRRHE